MTLLKNWLPLALVLGLAPSAARATTVEPLSVGDMARRATRITRGVVSATQDELAPNRRDVLHFVTLRVLEDVKGASTPTLRLYTLGGEAAGKRQQVPGAGEYAIGEEVLVFLVGKPDRYFPIGMALGKFTVVRTDGHASVARKLSGLHIEGGSPRARLGLDELLAEVRENLR